MSRVANNPVVVPEKVEVTISDDNVLIKGPLGEMRQELKGQVEIKKEENSLLFSAKESTKHSIAMSGTIRALGFEKKLQLIGVGYKAQAQGNKINLELGFSHSISHALPDGVTAQTPSQTEIILKSSDKQVVGQVAAEIRAYRPPEPYKGKGVRYMDEHVVMKEAKKA
jgi:large subunit ribosomal protein L6